MRIYQPIVRRLAFVLLISLVYVGAGCSEPPAAECPADVFCEAGHGVRDGTCEPCADGTWSEGPRAITYEGSDCAPRRLTFTCDPLACPEDTFFDRNACLPCPEGTRNPIDPDTGGADETCDPVACDVDEFVSDGACITCPERSTNPAGDDPSGPDTSCTPEPCAVDEYVFASECVPCPAGTINDAGDDPTSEDTACRAILTFEPEMLNHGSISVGDEGSLVTLTIANEGSAPVAGPFDATFSGPDESEFRVVSNDCSGAELPEGESCAIDVRFAPRTTGDKSALLTVQTGLGPFEIPNIGQALTAPGIYGFPSSNSFQNVVIGTTSAGTTFTVMNGGGDDDTGMFAVELTGDDANDFIIIDDRCSGAVLGGGEACDITVAFRPTRLDLSRAGLSAGALPGGTMTFGLLGAGVDSPSSVRLSSLYSDFGSAQIGQMSATRTFTAANDGNSPSGSLTASLAGSSPEEFIVVSDGCSATQLMPGESCEVDVVFSPTVVGDSAAELLLSQDPGGDPRAELTGEGVQ